MYVCMYVYIGYRQSEMSQPIVTKKIKIKKKIIIIIIIKIGESEFFEKLRNFTR